ncbi:MAG: cytochrome c [Saprospiraceae bacterium]|jgi:mono/diheme cytochrome c family protein|nr:cytochrome c [Saprospiraceae bacterium]MBK7796366.1 cytochrome c [Saprospiraceae bacterium]MBK8152931.1 cytochrome c [Saprospiraceae bacterium]MBK9379018.1 cytochrome c [Saprospiraceae bacterium]MBL0260247.1 cytochrome c [Saprospiraceae bacterium]
MKGGILLSVALIWMSCTQSKRTKDEFDQGRELYKTYCIKCHGADGNLMSNGAMNLRFSALSLQQKEDVIRYGRNLMSGFTTALDSMEIVLLAKYADSLKDSL